MDASSILRMLMALAMVVGGLIAALWIVRRLPWQLPGTGGSSTSRIAVVERAIVDSRNSLVLVRRDGREHLLLLGQGTSVVLEQGIVRDDLDSSAAAARVESEARARLAAAMRLQQEAERLSAFGRRALKVGREGLERWRGRRFARLLTRESKPAIVSAKPVKPGRGRRGRRS